ncbi:hypothetical protein ACFVXG_38425 [Kitasatospora sp. NPDC058162]|uniref:hypothetical protein n=1 Tax=Kitasatospora sp. NPDC058162 TaxID=3346362 RepID=UPI0036D75B32
MTGTATMTCGACGRTTAWNPWGACTWTCFDRSRPTEDEQQAMIDSAPEALAYYLGLGPGRPVDGCGQ